MEHNEKQLTGKEKMNIIFATLAGLGVGGVLGVIAYYQQWYCQDLCAKEFADSGRMRSASNRGVLKGRL